MALAPRTRATRLPRLVWTASLAFAAFGVRVGLRTTEASVVDDVLPRLPCGWTPHAGPVVDRLYSVVIDNGTHVLDAGPQRRLVAADRRDLIDALEADLHRYVAEFSHPWVFVHAGVVGWDGGAILIPGRSLSGKTTLVASLVRAGARYYSDEYAVLDGRGVVHPYAKPLSIRETPGQRPVRRAVDMLPGVVGTVPLPVRWIVVTRYRPRARWRPQPLSAGQATLALLDNAVPARRRPREVLAVLGAATAHAQGVKGLRGEADAMVPALLANH